ncbi:hypothetical protein OOK13_40410 [Streptomyces sp. NBC_00378]|uniref:hypothetical protein n=1 Tax=unclassified Streptomyces TaxID=2593676 RepID=UPI00225BF1FA|nr:MULTISPECIES: hypothetical protein [unclassified Streptomyces]MCX5112179.1 hypothetical protein [Streptomyces sp. NBC_00378]MCX5114626.1 hypothetical protein [Streptomyces sp. NBC_00378]
MTFLRRLFRRPASAPAPATFSPTGVLDGARWLVCDTTTCAHLTTRHTPHGTAYQCTRCGTTKGDQ